MTTKVGIEEFLDQEVLAVVGVSRSKSKFSSKLYKSLKTKGYRVLAINPKAEEIDGEVCFDSLKSLPESIDGVVIVTPSEQTQNIVKEANELEINHIWIQQGAESEEALDFCKRNNINVIYNQCILMFAEPISFFHKLHRSIWDVLGKIPE